MRRVSHNVRSYRRDGDKQMVSDAFFSDDFEAAGAIEYDEHKRRKAQEERGSGDAAGASGS